MTVKDFLNSELMPRREKRVDFFSQENCWVLPETVSLYSYGFNCTTHDKQSKPIIQHLEDMNAETFDLYEKFKDYEVKQVQVMAYTGKTNYDVAIHILIDISDEELKKMGVRV